MESEAVRDLPPGLGPWGVSPSGESYFGAVGPDFCIWESRTGILMDEVEERCTTEPVAYECDLGTHAACTWVAFGCRKKLKIWRVGAPRAEAVPLGGPAERVAWGLTHRRLLVTERMGDSSVVALYAADANQGWLRTHCWANDCVSVATFPYSVVVADASGVWGALRTRDFPERFGERAAPDTPGAVDPLPRGAPAVHTLHPRRGALAAVAQDRVYLFSWRCIHCSDCRGAGYCPGQCWDVEGSYQARLCTPWGPRGLCIMPPPAAPDGPLSLLWLEQPDGPAHTIPLPLPPGSGCEPHLLAWGPDDTICVAWRVRGAGQQLMFVGLDGRVVV